MPEILDIYLNDTNYAQTSKISEWLDISDIDDFKYSVSCSENCDVIIEWSADLNPIQIIETNIYNLTSGSPVNVHIPRKWRHARFSVINIASNPCDLKCSLFY